MRLRVNSLDLVGTSRCVELGPGLNIITGPITTGKTSLLRLLRGLLGSSLTDFPIEIRQKVSALSGSIIIGDSEYSIVRHFASTLTAKVEVAGSEGSWRLPVLQRDETSNLTYGQWLLDKLGLPRLRVPSAPTDVESPPTPVSINDYLHYCELRQDEIDNSVYGHREYFRNTKRRYVFQIMYGLYNVEMAGLQDELRELSLTISQLRAHAKVAENIFEGTPLENRAELHRQLDLHRVELKRLEESITEETAFSGIPQAVPLQDMRDKAKNLDQEIAEFHFKITEEKSSAQRLRQLLAQLEAQSGRLTRAIVAGQHLFDIEFVLCPRCGAPIDQSRGTSAICCLCLQPPAPKIGRQDLIKEQDRIHAQIVETRELIEGHETAASNIDKALSSKLKVRSDLGKDLDLFAKSFVSDHVQGLIDKTRQREALKASIQRLEDFMMLAKKWDDVMTNIKLLEVKKEEIEAKLEVAKSKQTKAEERINHLERRFTEIANAFQAPRFDGQNDRIDRETYLPIYDGRRFDDLSSQGLQVLVNVAHALAHQLTSIELELVLPNILFVDGLTSNIGHEGPDLERIRGVYDYLISLCQRVGDRLQIIVADSDIPSQARKFIRVELSEENRLIPGG